MPKVLVNQVLNGFGGGLSGKSIVVGIVQAGGDTVGELLLYPLNLSINGK